MDHEQLIEDLLPLSGVDCICGFPIGGMDGDAFAEFPNLTRKIRFLILNQFLPMRN